MKSSLITLRHICTPKTLSQAKVGGAQRAESTTLVFLLLLVSVEKQAVLISILILRLIHADLCACDQEKAHLAHIHAICALLWSGYILTS